MYTFWDTLFPSQPCPVLEWLRTMMAKNGSPKLSTWSNIYIVSEVRAIYLDNIQYSDPCTDRVLIPPLNMSMSFGFIWAQLSSHQPPTKGVSIKSSLSIAAPPLHLVLPHKKNYETTRTVGLMNYICDPLLYTVQKL